MRFVIVKIYLVLNCKYLSFSLITFSFLKDTCFVIHKFSGKEVILPNRFSTKPLFSSRFTIGKSLS